MTDLTPRQCGSLVEALSSSLEHGGTALGTVPKALRRLLEEGAWRDFTTSRGQQATYERFADFVVTPPLKGLGSSIDLVRRIVAEDVEALDLLDQALKGRQGERTDIGNNVPEVGTGRPEGNAQAKALRRLRKDSPELHAEVLAGNLSAHAAMVQAGYRPKTITVPVTRPEAVAKSLLKHMSADDIARLIAVLLGNEDGLCPAS